MAWLYGYLAGAVITYIAVVASSASKGTEDKDFFPCMVSALLWPMAWLYSISVQLGRGGR